MQHNYCRAYRLGQLREFEHWPTAADAALDNDTIVYLWDDLTVVRCPVASPPMVMLDSDSATPAWREFCSQRLSFQVPAEVVPGGPADEAVPSGMDS